MKISEKILTLRKKEGLSQEELANKLDVSRQTVYKWESDLATPEIEKIKNIAKMFNVSFDYLMDDDIESYEKEKKKTKAKFREAFYSGEKLSLKHADIDHGYIESRKSRASRADEYFDSRIIEMNDVLERVGATEIIRIQPDAAIAFFYIQKNHEFGFYYAGKIQFVCPIENFQELQIEGGSAMNVNTRTPMFGLGFGGGGINGVGFGSVPTNTTIESSLVESTLYYMGENGIEELDLSFGVVNMYLVDHGAKSPEDIACMKGVLKESVMKNLRNIQSILHANKNFASGIVDGSIKVRELDYDFYNDLFAQQEKSHSDYLQMLEEDASSENRKKYIKIGVLAGLGALAVVVGFFMIKGMLGL